MGKGFGLLFAAGLAAGLTMPLPATAADMTVALKAASCNACHGPDGRSEGGMPALAGKTAEELIKDMDDIRSGKEKAYVMHQHAKGYSEAEMKQIIQYFASLQKGGRK